MKTIRELCTSICAAARSYYFSQTAICKKVVRKVRTDILHIPGNYMYLIQLYNYDGIKPSKNDVRKQYSQWTTEKCSTSSSSNNVPVQLRSNETGWLLDGWSDIIRESIFKSVENNSLFL